MTLKKGDVMHATPVEKTVDTEGVDVLVIRGIRWAVPLFDLIADTPIGTTIKIIGREGGLVTFQEIRK